MAARPPQLIGESQAFHALLDHVSNAAALDRAMLVVGSRGTGKNLIASRLHFLSPRWEQSFTDINCAAFTDEGLEAELFGHAALTGRTGYEGCFVEADNGTLFLDNIDSVSPRLQEKLVKTLEEQAFTPLGSSVSQSFNVRVIAATSLDLPSEVARGRFMPDLLDQLAFDVITLPPLEGRTEDIAPLAEYFGRRMASQLGAESFPGFTPEVLAEFMSYEWPGNIRELKTVIDRSVAAAYLVDETLLTPITDIRRNPFESPWRPQPLAGVTPQTSVMEMNPEAGPSKNDDVAAENAERVTGKPSSEPAPPKAVSFADRVFRFERGLIDEALTVSKNHQGRAAEHLELSYHQFRGLLRKHGLKK